MKDDVDTQWDCLEAARACLFEAGRTLDPEVAAALRKLADRYLGQAESALRRMTTHAGRASPRDVEARPLE
jgi:hypothetical protein